MKNWKKEITTIPNLLSIFRLLLIPVYTVLFLKADSPSDYWLAGIILAVSCLTDLVDGKIARKYNMITRLGIALDPFADKMTQLALLICLAIRNHLLWIVFGLFFIKESFMLIMGIITYRKGRMLDGALMTGKVSTAVLFTSMILMVLIPDMSDRWVRLLVGLCFGVLLVAFIDYIRVYFVHDSRVRSLDEDLNTPKKEQ